MNYYYVYKTTNTINGKYYIGAHKSNNLHDKFYYGSGVILNKAIEKYGKENFVNEIIEYYPNEKLMFEGERKIIGNLWESDPMCYNQSPGGHGGSGKDHIKDMTWHKSTVPTEVRKKISQTLKGKSYITEEGRKKCSEASKGNQHALGLRYSGKHSEKGKRNIAKATSRRFKGKKLSNEHKAKLKEARKNIINPMEFAEYRKKVSLSKIGKKKLVKNGIGKMAIPDSEKWYALLSEGYKPINKR